MSRERENRDPLNVKARSGDSTTDINPLGFTARGLLADGEYLLSFVMPAIRANVVRKPHLVTVGAGDQIGLAHRQMTAPAVPSSLG